MELALAILAVLQVLVPIITPEIKALLDRGIDPLTVDWAKKYGRSVADLQAEVDAMPPRETSRG